MRAIPPIPATIFNGCKEKPRPSAAGLRFLASSWRKNLPRSSAAGGFPGGRPPCSLPSAAPCLPQQSNSERGEWFCGQKEKPRQSGAESTKGEAQVSHCCERMPAMELYRGSPKRQGCNGKGPAESELGGASHEGTKRGHPTTGARLWARLQGSRSGTSRRFARRRGLRVWIGAVSQFRDTCPNLRWYASRQTLAELCYTTLDRVLIALPPEGRERECTGISTSTLGCLTPRKSAF